MKIDERISPRSRLLMFQTLELLRKEIQPKFADWKDADDWLFSQLDFTKNELAQIYKGRGVLYHDAAAVDPQKAIQEYLNTLEFVHNFRNGDFKVLKVFATPDPLCGYGDIYASKRDYDLFSNSSEQPVVGYCVVDSLRLPVKVPDICWDFCPTVADAIADYKQSLHLPDLSLAARLVSFYKDFDFYDFTDNMEVNQTEEDMIVELEQQLDSPKSIEGVLETMREICLEDNLTPAQRAEADRLIQDLSGLLSKAPSKVSLADKIASAAGRTIESSGQATQKAKANEPER